MSEIKTIDSKGRLTLGEEYANRTVLVEETGKGQLLVRLARVLPEKEVWLYENPKALARVRTGLKEAQQRKVSKSPPDLTAAGKLAD